VRKVKINNWNQINPAWPDKKNQTLRRKVRIPAHLNTSPKLIVVKPNQAVVILPQQRMTTFWYKVLRSDIYALGFFGFAYYIENSKKINAVAIDNGNGGILPSAATVENASYQPLSRPAIYLRQCKIN